LEALGASSSAAASEAAAAASGASASATSTGGAAEALASAAHCVALPLYCSSRVHQSTIAAVASSSVSNLAPLAFDAHVSVPLVSPRRSRFRNRSPHVPAFDPVIFAALQREVLTQPFESIPRYKASAPLKSVAVATRAR